MHWASIFCICAAERLHAARRIRVDRKRNKGRPARMRANSGSIRACAIKKISASGSACLTGPKHDVMTTSPMRSGRTE